MARAARIALDLALATSQTLRPSLGIAWQYAKVECVPPMTTDFFNGPAGKKLEEAVGGIADKVIAGIAGQIKQMDDAEAKAIKDKEAAIKAAQDKIKAKEADKRKQAQLKVTEAKEKEAKAAAEKAKAKSKAEEEKKAADAKAKSEKKKK